MSDGLRKALDTAEGRSDFIIVVVADIRGFSAFSLTHESPDVAMYIKRVYMRLIDDYFPFASFHKATGDGLLMTVPFDENDLAEKAQTTVQSCLRCLEEFSHICDADPMINFPAPEKIGFGVSRGTACCLVSGKKVIDYSGHQLNLASRLMDFARPSGIVLDGMFGVELLTEETRKLFEPHDLYIRSVAEEDPRRVHVLKDVVEIPDEAKRPLRFEHWETTKLSRTVAEWQKSGKSAPRWVIRLPKRLKRPDGIMISLEHPAILGRKVSPTEFRFVSFNDFGYSDVANEPTVSLDVGAILNYAAEQQLPRAITLTAKISFVPR